MNLLSGADNMLTTITSTYSLSPGSASSYSEYDETELITSEEWNTNDSENALTSKLSYSTYDFDNDDPPFLNPKFGSDANMLKVAANNVSSLESVPNLSPLDDSWVHNAKGVQNLGTEHGNSGEFNVENHPRKESTSKCGKASQSKHGSEQNTVSQISNTSITEVLRVIAVSSPEMTNLTSLMHSKTEVFALTVQSLGDLTNQKTQESLTDCVQMGETTLRQRQTENDSISNDQTITAEAIPPVDNALSKVNLQTGDMPLAEKQHENEQSRMDFGLSHQVKVMKRKSLITFAVAQQATQIIWFLLKGIYILLMLTLVATVHIAKVCPMILQFVQTLYRWIKKTRKYSNAEEIEINENYSPVWMQHDSSSDEADSISLGQELLDEPSINGRKDLRLF
ncbi:hypothetical protein TTRE_0000434501 [Trichuris trichiura]|uniref:Uncharacterized protein n=1 Tax=Trichuris trichiura TaxID=36087 RepID=A0A077Z794_TRITR|nr:hypothetical protein TTRE_0000434501 [Trichuris trichiura]